MKALRTAGLSLIEVLISILIFSIGALGVLGMFTTTLYLNMDSRQSQEATVIANWMLEQLQILDPDTDTRVSGCAAPVGCFADVGAGGALIGPGTSAAKTVTMSELQGDVTYGNRYQIHWVREDDVPVTDMVHYRVRVYWPRKRECRTLDPADGAVPGCETGFVNCFTTTGNLCRRLEMNTYK